MHLLQLVVVSVFCWALVQAAPPIRVVNQDHYDQRQNGTENYRVNIDGVLVAVAPAEVLLSSAVDFEDILGMLDNIEPSSPERPERPELTNFLNETQENSSSTDKPSSSKPTLKKAGFRRRLANFILPILRRNRQQ